MMNHIKQMNRSEQGSVLLEFCLVLPIYLLLFGGTFLMFDISMGRLHLQESNRNLAWIESDRFDSQGLINKELYKRVTLFYDTRNALESNWDQSQNMWSFGVWKNETPDWNTRIKEFKENKLELKADNDFLSLYSGNMELKMEKLSAVYIGAVGLSSVLMPLEYADNSSQEQNSRVIGDQTISHNETVPLYKRGYVLTRALDEDHNRAEKNGEMLLIRRTGIDTRENVDDTNSLLMKGVLFRTWPSNGKLLETARLILGI